MKQLSLDSLLHKNKTNSTSLPYAHVRFVFNSIVFMYFVNIVFVALFFHIISFSSSFSQLPIDIPVSMESNVSFYILMCLEALGWPPRPSLKLPGNHS